MKEQTVSSIKIQLEAMLEALTLKTGEISLVNERSDGREIKIKSDYDVEEFGFSVGAFIRNRHDSDPLNIGLCVGVGRDHKNSRENELWFLFRGDEGISCFSRARASDFKENGFVLVE